MKFVIQSFLLLVLMVASTMVMNPCQSFVVVPNNAVIPSLRKISSRQTLRSYSGEDDTSTKPVKQVLCPDCDLCDGSGRYVNVQNDTAVNCSFRTNIPTPSLEYQTTYDDDNKNNNNTLTTLE